MREYEMQSNYHIQVIMKYHLIFPCIVFKYRYVLHLIILFLYFTLVEWLVDTLFYELQGNNFVALPRI